MPIDIGFYLCGAELDAWKDLLIFYFVSRMTKPDSPPSMSLYRSLALSHECFINAGTAKAWSPRFVTPTALCASLTQITTRRFDYRDILFGI